MEKKQYRDYHLPFATAQLTNASDFLEDAVEPAGNYNKPNEGEQALVFLFSEIFKSGQDFTGTLFSFREGGLNYSLPRKWEPIMGYLQDKGLIDGIYAEPLYYDEPKSVKFVLSPVPVNPDFWARLTDGNMPRSGWGGSGSSFELDGAVAKAVGEFLERYSLLLYKEGDLLKTSPAGLAKTGHPHLDMRELAGFSKEQKARNRQLQFDENSNFLWVEGRSLFSNKNILIPAQLIFWNYNRNHQDWREPALREPNTNGAGGHCTLAKAILSGLYEAIQRDGFLVYWLNGQGPPRIDLGTIDYEPLKKIIEDYRNLGFEVNFYNTTTDLNVPSCVCTIFDHSGVGPKISLAGGCGADWDRTLLDSLMEAGGVYHWQRKKKETEKNLFFLGPDYQPFRDYSLNQQERLELWANEKMFGRFGFFLEGKTQSLRELKKRFSSFSLPEEELKYLVEKFESLGKGYEIIYYQARQKILDDLGYFSVQVVVPALTPLYLREIFAPLGARRLKEVPEKLGFKPAPRWNPWPHPFP